MSAITVIIVDDHRLIRKGISSLLNSDADIQVIGEAQDEKECYALLETVSPDVILMDISLEESDGIELTREISKTYPNSHVVILSMHMQEDYIKESIKAGAKGYILKDSPHEELIRAVKLVTKGQQYFAPEVSQVMVQTYIDKMGNVNEPKLKKSNVLTKRELEIVKLISDGLSNQKIADKLDISHRTVDTHRTNIMQKVKVKNVAELVKYAIKNNLVEI